VTRLVEIEPGRFVVDRRRMPAARSDLPRPFVISDEMPPTEQVDGRFYTSKAAFRATGRALGLTEVGTEKFKPRTPPSSTPEARARRKAALKVAAEKYRAGHRVRSE
jgi:hypothetical protein